MEEETTLAGGVAPSVSSLKALSQIRSHLPGLARAESDVASWVLQNSQQIVRLSMAQVARECGVSDTTVLRFCRAVGFHGYTDSKPAVERDMASPTQVIHDDLAADDTPPTVARKVFLANIQALKDTMEVLDLEGFEKAVDMLEGAKSSLILLVGVGTPGLIVQSMYNFLFRLGLNCRAETDSYLQLMQAALIRPGDVVVGISQSGSSSDPVLTMAEAKRNGGQTICITGNAQSPITEYADVTLLSVSSETRSETIASRIAQSTIVDALYVALALRDIERAIEGEGKIWNATALKSI